MDPGSSHLAISMHGFQAKKIMQGEFVTFSLQVTQTVCADGTVVKTSMQETESLLTNP